MIDNLSFLQIRNVGDSLPTKSPALMYRSNKPLNKQLPSEKVSMVKKLLGWINRGQFCGYFLGILGSIMCIASTTMQSWRVWQVDPKDGTYPGVIWIGIWKACYQHSTQPKNRYIHCEDFTGKLKMLPKEIFLAQDLMTLSCIVGAVAITIMSFALVIVVKDTEQKKYLPILFNTVGFLNVLAGIMILIPTLWNRHSVLEDKSIPFPLFFKMPRVPRRQEVGAAIYIGYSAAFSFLLSGIMIGCNKRILQVHAGKALPPAVLSLTTQFSSSFGSSVIISVINREEPDFRDDELTSLYSEDLNKDSSHSNIPQLLENSKKISVVAVTPYQ
ncbi:claudin-4-like [Erythrolamprus reginae]|uniref:claudin-4-like n=1 Tax=Erythrolamprus reginae TaxID=121349 RepID=UPI00396C855A